MQPGQRLWPALRNKLRSGLILSQRLGMDPLKLRGFLQELPGFLRDYRSFRNLDRTAGFPLPHGKLDPVLGETSDSAGVASGHYFHQDLYVARRIFELKPRRHIDVGSRIDGFVAHVAAFRPIEVLDIRPIRAEIPNVTFRQANLMDTPNDLVNATDSLSSLHAIEHFGLGRYGDPLDPLGHARAIQSLAKILEPGGTLHLSFPIGPARVDFNAQRVLSLRVALDLFRPIFSVYRFAYVGDDGALVVDATLDAVAVESNAGCTFGCGIFELRKL